MQIEIIILALIIFFVLTYNGQLSFNQFVIDNFTLFTKLKEDDWEFYCRAKYGQNINADTLLMKRIKSALLVTVIVLFFFLKDLNLLKIAIAVTVGFVTFKVDYLNIKKYYKKHIYYIDSELPHYLKDIEILIQHYTVPVAIGKSMADAPDIFKEGLQELINDINSGDDSIEPYMNFARKYPVRDSMRMMRLLYRLSLGSQERKQEQLITFSKSISSLQQKARETKYKARLEKMESKTMSMLVSTGFGVMIILVLAVMQLMNL